MRSQPLRCRRCSHISLIAKPGAAAKRKEREERIASLSTIYHAPLSSADKSILGQPASQIVAGVQGGTFNPSDVLVAYSKKALKAHQATNCLTEILIPTAEAWAKECNTQGPLAGMPVSLKDTVAVPGFDSCIGYSAWVGKPLQKEAALVRLLRDAGAVPFVKTNVPITLLSLESANDVFGTTTNPHNKNYTPGGSSGGEGALLAYGGSRLGIGTDVAGSVRAPAHYSGIYTIKASMNRFLKTGNPTSMPGQEGIPAVYSPMTRTLEDLETFWRAIVGMKPWDYDHSCLPIPWREIKLSQAKSIKWGIMWDDGVVTPSPACRRALQEVVSVLQADGHEVVTIDPPSPYEGLKIASQLLLADGGKTCTKPIRTGETNDPGMQQALAMFRTPRFLRLLYAWYLRHIRGDEIYAGLVEGWYEKTVPEYLALVAQREAYRERWFAFMHEQALDFVLTVPNSLPAVPHGGMKEGWKACGYTFLFNLLDYSAGVLPITHVDAKLDALQATFKPKNAIEAGSYRVYNAEKMHGLPVGVQVVGKRLEEEKVLEGMKLIERLLKMEGKAYVQLEVGD
ncbi:amidase signature enzyme [Laetiporus sulphureus 93-53]|uniref:amidase n=1 Tax=Laetiporus sulphureus 93-53 TaxID=1314785 RepID=A0A165GLF8_9APHY|nr:amidase signature enzyme [Laetiporus sulphureus 93-53]KZT10515.1 amidase signature enzyme [Laetiporus sulphureus 93-53]